MKAKQKKALLSGIFGLVFLFILVGLIFFNLNVGPETAKWILDINNFYTKLFTNLKDNIVIYGLFIVALVVGYYFMVYKPKISKKR